jgi:hypothetical protein
VIALEDYPYVGIKFIGDPDMPLPPGSAYRHRYEKDF